MLLGENKHKSRGEKKANKQKKLRGFYLFIYLSCQNNNVNALIAFMRHKSPK